MGAHGALNVSRGSSGLTICQVKYLEKKGHYDQAGNMGTQQLLTLSDEDWMVPTNFADAHGFFDSSRVILLVLFV